MKYIIYVSKGNFNTVKEAAFSEKSVNWANPSSEECVACTECFAALDMAEVLLENKKLDIKVKDISDIDLSGDVLIFMGEKSLLKASELYGIECSEVNDEEAFRVQSKIIDNKQIVLIYGNDKSACLYGASSYMEHHGIRFIFPGKEGTIYNPSLDLSENKEIDIYEKPSFVTRESCSEFMYDTHFDFLMWMVHSKMNCAFMYSFENPELLHKLCIKIVNGGHTIHYKYMDINHEYPYKHKIFGGENKSDDPYPISPLYKGDINNDGILTYGEAHPEWYAQVNGERTLKRDYNAYNERGYATGDYICTSNENGVNEFCRLMVDSLVDGEYKDADALELFALDNGTWCECEKCKEIPYSYRQLMIAYKLDKAIKKATEEGRIQRKIHIRIPAYHETLTPPDRPLPDDFDYSTIAVFMAVIERCYVHNINDEKCVETNKILHDHLLSWSDGFYKGEIGIIEYYNVSSFASMPFIFTKKISNDMPFYYKKNVRHFYYMHMTASKWGVRAINNYLHAKLMWNIDADTKTLINEYFLCKYGEYADKMRIFYEELESACENCKRIKHYQYVYNVRRELTVELANKSKDIFDFNHMKLNERADDYQAGPSLVETLERYTKVFEEFSLFIKDKDFSMFEEDYLQLEYGYNMLNFIYYKVLEVMEETSDYNEKIKYFSKKLENTVNPLDGYDVRILFKNGLTATKMFED